MEEAKHLDSQFPAKLRGQFHIPTFASMGLGSDNRELTYLCGNSLGLMPRATRDAVDRELNAWAARGVEGHFNHPFNGDAGDATNWVDIDLPVVPLLAPIVGAQDDEVAIMNSLTANLNALLVAFYKPEGIKNKILFEKGAFPSDFYAFHEQCRLHGVDPTNALVQLEPREGEYYLRTEDILAAIDQYSNQLALVCLPGIQYYTGQLLDIARITDHAHVRGITVGWDLAHAVGNVPLKLHEWGVDFACWCSYKYLNSGPGAIGGAFVHARHSTPSLPRLAGWWGNNRERRFAMLEKFEPIDGALGFRQSNPSVIDVVCLRTSLQLFQQFGSMAQVRERSVHLTSFLKRLLKRSVYYRDQTTKSSDPGFTIITPEQESLHGAQLSLLFYSEMDKIFKHCRSRGLIADERRPNVIRLAPAPLYNTFQDVANAAQILEKALQEIFSK
ncbi:BNA5 (YLR231C) [Zygosaccharomyces parabailii]|nr:BNA5 (YLR231C) [Zygosaccharomyces parabailii]CDH09891.1 probable Kynureninase [Zygosaccharomyces bailii ISA1307]